MSETAAGPTRKTILISDILLDPHNVRIGEQESQSDAIAAMIQEQKDKLVNLADDILEWGLNPTDIPAVIPHDGKYMVPEGNRRVTALKLLHNPELTNGTSIEKKFKALAAKGGLPTEIECVVFNSREDVQHWIDLKHQSDNEGRGTERWNSVQKARASGKTTRELEMLDLVVNEGSLSEEERRAAMEITFPITNLKRLVNTPQVLEKLGVSWGDDSYKFLGDKDKSLGVMTLMVQDIQGDLSVTEIKKKDQRIEYADELLARAGITSPIAPPGTGSSTNGNTSSSKSKKTPTRRTLKKSNKRSTLIPSSFALHIRQARVNEVFKELKDLRISDYRNAVAVSFRVFLEFSADEYLRREKPAVAGPAPKVIQVPCPKCSNTISVAKGGGKFSPTLLDKLVAVIEHMKTAGTLNHGEVKAVEKSIRTKTSITAPGNFNDFVHNSQVIPEEKELKDMWDMLQLFIGKIWA